MASDNDGGSPITSYIVEYRDGSDLASSFQNRSFGPSVLSSTLDGLRPFVTYEVRIRANNIVGSSSPSNSLNSQTHPEGKTLEEEERWEGSKIVGVDMGVVHQGERGGMN